MRKFSYRIYMGKKVKDKITGFAGIMTGMCEYQYKTTEVLIEPIQLNNGLPVQGQWFVENRIEEIRDERKIGYRG